MDCGATRVWVIREPAPWAIAYPTSRKGQQAAAVLLPGGSPGSCSLVKQKTLGTQLLVQIRTWKKFRAEAELFSLTAGPQERVSIQRRITLKKPNAERVRVQWQL